MKRTLRLSAALAFLLTALIQARAMALCGEPDEKEKLDEESCHFFEGLPPGVTGGINNAGNVLTLQFMIPQEKIDVEIYHKGQLVTKDMREIKSQEMVCYDLPKKNNSERLVLIKVNDGETYGEKY